MESVTPPSSLSEAEINENIEAYKTAVKNGDAKQIEEILKCCYEFDKEKGQSNYKLTEAYYVVAGIMKARLDMNMEKAGYNLMDPYNKYNNKTIDLIDEISRYSLFSGLGMYAPNISGTKNPLDSNYDTTHRLILRVNLDNYQVSFYNSDNDKKSKVSYVVLPWDENHQQRLNQAMIKELQSKKKDFESKVIIIYR
ncbi:hypothetical protein [Anaerosacchariphilus polymeriproducens]|uniref:Uncharacterized protein n=1 Tax=Anaerosacchariphilus polymeriproducens TaxID=1812858 RepID=A0A371AXC4_9FIRM|nr:hypothetical protein [Anaerosacchariphilus polymeriproducens]RDU24140.1 hypothetical protein DWV06_05425 [Anaerosacchariphilus polymeriproducens]